MGYRQTEKDTKSRLCDLKPGDWFFFEPEYDNHPEFYIVIDVRRSIHTEDGIDLRPGDHDVLCFDVEHGIVESKGGGEEVIPIEEPEIIWRRK